MRKLGVDEWLMADVMYLNSRSVVKINSTISESFDVKVGIHQGSVLSSLLFIMVLEALSQDHRMGLHWELLYADDLVIAILLPIWRTDIWLGNHRWRRKAFA